MELTSPKAVLFDWDNTLVNTWPIIHQALEDTFTERGMKPWTIDEVKEKVARSMRDAFPELFGENWQEAGERYQYHYRKYHIDRLEPLPGVIALLEYLPSTGIPVGIVSNKKSKNLREEIAHLGWNPRFSAIVGSDDAEHDKPHPAPVMLALKQMGLAAGPDIWFIGDSHIDLEVAANCGLTAIFYGDGVIDETGGKRTHRGQSMHFHALDHEVLSALFRKHF